MSVSCAQLQPTVWFLNHADILVNSGVRTPFFFLPVNSWRWMRTNRAALRCHGLIASLRHVDDCFAVGEGSQPSPALCVVFTANVCFFSEAKPSCMCVKCEPPQQWMLVLHGDFPLRPPPIYSSSSAPNKSPTLTTLSRPGSMPFLLYLIPLSFTGDLAMLLPEHSRMICSTFF